MVSCYSLWFRGTRGSALFLERSGIGKSASEYMKHLFQDGFRVVVWYRDNEPSWVDSRGGTGFLCIPVDLNT